jgi:hypothetical protein
MAKKKNEKVQEGETKGKVVVYERAAEIVRSAGLCSGNEQSRLLSEAKLKTAKRIRNLNRHVDKGTMTHRKYALLGYLQQRMILIN